MRERLRELDEDAVIIHLDTFVDVEGNTLSIPEAARYFCDGCPVPLFRGNMGGDGEGMCAIAYTDFYEAGQQAATMASLILTGTNTGFSSFDRLTYDAIDFVKLDKTFVDSFLTAKTETVTLNLVRLTHGLGKRIVMEGVETREQLEACVRLGCDFIQGYYFSKPMDPLDVPTWEPPQNGKRGWSVEIRSAKPLHLVMQAKLAAFG